MSKITLTDLVNLENETTAVNAINANSTVIQTAFDNTLSRDGTSPNQMAATLDMNANRIINLPQPSSDTEPLRLIDAATLNGGGTLPISPLPTGGTIGQVLEKNSSVAGDVSWQTPVTPPTGGNTSQILKKNSSTNFDYSWSNPYPTGGLAGQVLEKNSTSDFDVVWATPINSSPFIPPQGRLTLTSATPVMGTSVTNATTLFYAPFQGNLIPIVASGITQVFPFTSSVNDAVGLSIVLGSNWAANANYDVFAAFNGSTLTLGTGPDWSQGASAGSNNMSASSRGTGAGSTQLQLANGVLTNANSIILRFNNSSTFTAAQNTATYLGTVRTGSAGQISFTYGSKAVGGGVANLFVWNAYNQVPVRTTVSDTNNFWTLSSATIRASDNSTNNRVNFVTGLAQNGIKANFQELIRTTNVVGATAYAGLCINNTTGFDVGVQVDSVAAVNANDWNINPSRAYGPVLGANFISAVEASDGTNAATYFGAANVQVHALSFEMEM